MNLATATRPPDPPLIQPSPPSLIWILTFFGPSSLEALATQQREREREINFAVVIKILIMISFSKDGSLNE